MPAPVPDTFYILGGFKNTIFETAVSPAGLIKRLRPFDPLMLEFLELNH